MSWKKNWLLICRSNRLTNFPISFQRYHGRGNRTMRSQCTSRTFANSRFVAERWLFLSRVRRTEGIRAYRKLINQHLGFKQLIKSWWNNIIYSTAYQSKALELAHLTIPLLWQSAHRGCAGIGRQLLPLKASYRTKDVGNIKNQTKQ